MKITLSTSEVIEGIYANSALRAEAAQWPNGAIAAILSTDAEPALRRMAGALPYAFFSTEKRQRNKKLPDFSAYARGGSGRYCSRVKTMIDKKNYQAFADAHAPKSKIWKNLLFAFLIGGAICFFAALSVVLAVLLTIEGCQTIFGKKKKA